MFKAAHKQKRDESPNHHSGDSIVEDLLYVGTAKRRLKEMQAPRVTETETEHKEQMI
jgi:hypothetical protein